MRICMLPSELLDYALFRDGFAKQVLLGRETDYIDSPFLKEYIILRLIGLGFIKRAIEMAGFNYVDELDIVDISNPETNVELFLSEIYGLLTILKDFGL